MTNSSEEKPENEFLLTFDDLLSIIKKNKSIICYSSIIFGVLAFCYALTKPIEYEAEATFKEKGKSQSGLGNSLSAAFFSISDGSDSNAMTIMRSRKLIEDLVKNQGLQGALIKKQNNFSFLPFQTIKNNLLIEYALFKKLHAPILKEPEIDLELRDIAYNDEIPKNLNLKVLSKEKYSIHDGEKKETHEGVFGQSFSKDNYSFTLNHSAPSPISQGEYTLVLLPLEKTAQILSKQFTIESDRFDKSLLKITYQHANRKLAANNVNALMSIYQNYIQCEHELICEKQVGYLIQRQKEMAKILEDMMKDHAEELSSDLTTSGFATSEKAMDFLANTQYHLKQKLYSVNLEIQRLQRAKSETPLDNDIFSSLNNLDVINRIATEKRLLKQQADSLNLVLRNTPLLSKEFNETFISQLMDLEEIKQALKESHLALANLEKNEIPPLYPKLSDNSKYIFNSWHERMVKSKENLVKDPAEKNCLADWQQCKKSFSSYLMHLNHYLSVAQRSIEERLIHQQAPLKEFQGINLNIAKELYLTYNKELSLVESQMSQHEFISNQLDEPDFEISSLSTMLTDHLSLEMIVRTSDIILALKDQNNRSTKEQERLNLDLIIQKGFLKTHIQQSIALLRLRENFLKEKIEHLQSVNLSLIQEEISILENQINEYITNTLENLKQEKELIENNLVELRMEMSTIPQKWAAEELIEQQMDINKSLVEEISKLVESKNIANNLEKLQSAPVDIAFPPIHPKSPRLFLLTLIGSAAGALLSFLWILGWSVVNGVQVSKECLTAAGQYVCGSINRKYHGSSDKDPLLDSDLATLRRLMAFIDTQNTLKLQNTLLLLEGNGPYYASQLAELMSKKGLKILILELHFDEYTNSTNSGLLQYLEGKTNEPQTLHFTEYDKIVSGGICRYANELIGSKKFKDLLGSLVNLYDWVIISSTASALSAEGENLLDLFSIAAVSVKDESIQELKNLILHANEQKHKIAFILT